MELQIEFPAALWEESKSRWQDLRRIRLYLCIRGTVRHQAWALCKSCVSRVCCREEEKGHVCCKMEIVLTKLAQNLVFEVVSTVAQYSPFS